MARLFLIGKAKNGLDEDKIVSSMSQIGTVERLSEIHGHYSRVRDSGSPFGRRTAIGLQPEEDELRGCGATPRIS
jgi:hypothetical protein